MRIVDSRTNSLRQRRRALNPYNAEKEDCSFELGGFSIGACILILFFIGFSAVTAYLTISCSKFSDAGVSKGTSSLRPKTDAHIASVASNLKETTAKISEAANAPKGSSVQFAIPQPPAGSKGLPPLCTDEQSNAVLRMLPAEGCLKPAFTQACSFTQATTKSCRDPYWMREFYATTELKSPFNAFFIGYLPSIDQYSDTPIDLLHIGTHDPKYSSQKTKWLELAGLPASASCQRSVEVKGETKQAKVVLVMQPNSSEDPVNHYQENLEIPKEMLEALGESPTIDDAFFTSKLPSADSQIHYLRYLSLSPERYEVMKQMTRLSSVWYLEFTLDWKSGLSKPDQQELLNQFLPEKGFVCYWAGNDNLWRITNCWQSHYWTSTWSNVACVNSRIPDAKPLLDRMEKIFTETLAKDITF